MRADQIKKGLWVAVQLNQVDPRIRMAVVTDAQACLRAQRGFIAATNPGVRVDVVDDLDLMVESRVLLQAQIIDHWNAEMQSLARCQRAAEMGRRDLRGHR